MTSINNDPLSKQPKILLVDDREDNLLSIEAILAPDNYQFFRAYSGEQALKILLNEFDFAMILMDVKMPILNGFETASLIYEREKLKNIPIIFITANNYGDENIFKGYKAGGIDYIFKPINPEVLRAKVSVFIDLYRKNALLLEQEQKLSVANKKMEMEISDLKILQEKMKHRNIRLQKEIFALESLLVLAHLPVNVEFKQTDLTKLFKGFLDEMDDLVKEKMATVSIDPLPSLRVSPVLMRPLFQYLIRNALHYSKQDVNPIINVRSETEEPSIVKANFKNNHDQKYCYIIFEDNGDGFDGKNNDEIFGSDGESETSGEPKTVNTLALCRKIMEKHNGFIVAKTETNGGSAFIVSFPVAKSK
ncbi:MAG TPA: response regulator [Cyclobacteriaceae bacterium]|nr:response regulator [Cyclobacteriaceae bacterium]